MGAGASREGPGGGMVCELSREVLPGDDGSQGRGVWRARETGEQLLGGAGFPGRSGGGVLGGRAGRL